MKLTQTEHQICDDYEQLSLFSYFRQSETYNPIKDYAKHGSGFENGKHRIKKFFAENSSLNDRIKFLKKEYGVGGFGIPGEKPCFVHNGRSDASCHTIEYYDENMQNIELKITYSELAKVISEMIPKNEY